MCERNCFKTWTVPFFRPPTIRLALFALPPLQPSLVPLPQEASEVASDTVLPLSSWWCCLNDTVAVVPVERHMILKSIMKTSF